MKKYLIFLCIFELFLLISFFYLLHSKEKLFASNIILDLIENSSQKDNEKNQSFLVTYIFDGDTFEINSKEKVRLICINTPEKDEEYYEEAKNYLEKLILEKNVELISDISDRDKYGRLLRYVYVEGVFVNEKIVQEGYAKMYEYKPNTKLCPIIEEAENYAKEKDKGIWKDEIRKNDEEESENEINPEMNSQENCQCIQDLDCPDFANHNEAQECYEYCFKITGKDFHRLDREKDRLACETLN